MTPTANREQPGPVVDVDHRLASVQVRGPDIVYRIVMGVSHNHFSVEISEELVQGYVSPSPPGWASGWLSALRANPVRDAQPNA